MTSPLPMSRCSFPRAWPSNGKKNKRAVVVQQLYNNQKNAKLVLFSAAWLHVIERERALSYPRVLLNSVHRNLTECKSLKRLHMSRAPPPKLTVLSFGITWPSCRTASWEETVLLQKEICKVQGGDGGWLPGWVDLDLGCSTILLGQYIGIYNTLSQNTLVAIKVGNFQ